MKLLIFLVPSIFFLSGCALAPKVVHLGPLPPVSEAKFSKPVCIVVSEFKDQRKEPQILGYTYNLGVKTSDVKTFANVPEWLRTSYVNELKKAGAVECSSKTEKIVVSAAVKEVTQDESWNINTSVKIDLTVASGTSVLTKSFEGTSSQISHAASEGEFTESLYKAVQYLMKKSVPTIVATTDEEK